MIKYIKEDTIVAFAEVPDEITVCVNISGCKNSCVGCHSPYLKKDIGKELDFKAIDELINKNDGITCFCFMGEGNDPKSLQEDILHLKETYPNIKRALYSGRDVVDEEFYWEHLNYLKIGPYKAEFGPLNTKTTNQRLYYHNDEKEAEIEINGVKHQRWIDITHKFWKK